MINPFQAALLDRLKIDPFEYKMHIKRFMVNDKLFSAKVLRIKKSDVLAAFSTSAANLIAISLASGYMISSVAKDYIDS